MGKVDFLIWFGWGSYGGLACALFAAVAMTIYALGLRRGTGLQLARAVLICLAAACCMFVPIWWDLNRLELFGPALGLGEVGIFLAWSALAGWLAPVGALLGYIALARPQLPAPAQPLTLDPALLHATLANPERQREPLGPGVAWGELIWLDTPVADALTGDASDQTPVSQDPPRAQRTPLTRQVVLVGREADNDIVLDDESVSRHHAELRWERGRVQLTDLGSLNSTLVNRQRARGPVPLRSGDALEFGGLRFRIALVEAAEAAPELDAPPGEEERAAENEPDEAVIETLKTRRATPGDDGESGGLESGDLGSDGALDALDALDALELVAMSGPERGTRWRLDAPVVTIGRDPQRQVRLTDESVSRLHAQIIRQRAGYFVSDLRSRNGASLNGQRLGEPHLLHAGDTLRIGEVTLAVEALPASETPAIDTSETSISA